MRISDWSSDVCSSDLPRWHILVVYGAPQLAIECAAQRGHEPEETDETQLAQEQQRHAPGASTRAAEPVPARMHDHQTVLDERQRIEVLPDLPRPRLQPGGATPVASHSLPTDMNTSV